MPAPRAACCMVAAGFIAQAESDLRACCNSPAACLAWPAGPLCRQVSGRAGQAGTQVLLVASAAGGLAVNLTWFDSAYRPGIAAWAPTTTTRTACSSPQLAASPTSPNPEATHSLTCAQRPQSCSARQQLPACPTRWHAGLHVTCHMSHVTARGSAGSPGCCAWGAACAGCRAHMRWAAPPPVQSNSRPGTGGQQYEHWSAHSTDWLRTPLQCNGSTWHLVMANQQGTDMHMSHGAPR